MLRLAIVLLVGAFLLEFGRSRLIDFADSESMTVRIEGTDQLCVVQRKNAGGLFHSEIMPCTTAQQRVEGSSGFFGREVAYVTVAHFSYRSPVDQRTYAGTYRSKPAPTPPALGPMLEIRVSKVTAGRYRVIN